MKNKTLRIAGYANDSIVDGPGLRFTVFTQGCYRNCAGCHNPQTHDPEGGYEISLRELYDMICGNKLLDGVTFSGGEPFLQANALYELGLNIRKLNLDIITFTGYTYEYLTENSDDRNGFSKLLSVTDYLVDGSFIENLKNSELRFKGSENQRVIEVRKSMKMGSLVETQL